MKKSIKMLIVAVIVLAILGGIYFLLPVIMPEEKNEPLEDIPESIDTANEDFIINEKTEDVQKVTFSTGDITYSVVNAQEPVIEGYTSHVLDKSELYMALFNGTSIISERIIADKNELSAYGLEKAEKYVSLLLKDGTQKTVYIGNPTNIGGEYYAKSDFSDKVYVISQTTASNLLRHPSEYRSLDIAEISKETVSDFSVSKGSTKVLDVKYISTDSVNGQNVHSYELRYPYSGVKANVDSIMAFCQTLSSVTASEIVEENPKNFSQYGLDSPYVLTVTDEAGTSVIKMGNYSHNGEIYVMKDNIPVVFSAVCSFYESVKNIKPDEFVERFVHLFNISDVSKINVKNSKESHELEIIKKSDDEYEYKLDGKFKVKENFSPIYTSVIGITATSYLSDKKPGGEEYCSIKFRFNDKKEKSYTYYVYDDRYCIVKADNGVVCLVTKKSVDEIFRLINK